MLIRSEANELIDKRLESLEIVLNLLPYINIIVIIRIGMLWPMASGTFCEHSITFSTTNILLK